MQRRSFLKWLGVTPLVALFKPAAAKALPGPEMLTCEPFEPPHSFSGGITVTWPPHDEVEALSRRLKRAIHDRQETVALFANDPLWLMCQHDGCDARVVALQKGTTIRARGTALCEKHGLYGGGITVADWWFEHPDHKPLQWSPALGWQLGLLRFEP